MAAKSRLSSLTRRFSIRTLLIVITITCLYGGWRVEQARRQMATVEKLNGLVFFVNEEVSEPEIPPEDIEPPSPVKEPSPTDTFDPFASTTGEAAHFTAYAPGQPAAIDKSRARETCKLVTVYYDIPPGDLIGHSKVWAQTEAYLRTGSSDEQVLKPDLMFHLRRRATAVTIHGPLTEELCEELRRLPHLRVILRYAPSCPVMSDEERAEHEEFDARIKRELPHVQYRWCVLDVVG